MPEPKLQNVVVEDARIIFRNFAGKEGRYNREGDRDFALLLDTEIAEQMQSDGWNVKYLPQRNEDAAPQAFLKIKVGYKNRPPLIVLITSKGRTQLGQDEVEIIDWIDIANVDLIVRPFRWAKNDDWGVSAYLKTMYIKVAEDQLVLKYADLPEIGMQREDYVDAEVIMENQHALPARAGQADDDDPPWVQ